MTIYLLYLSAFKTSESRLQVVQQPTALAPGELVLLDPDHRVKPQRSKYWVFYEGASLGVNPGESWEELATPFREKYIEVQVGRVT